MPHTDSQRTIYLNCAVIRDADPSLSIKPASAMMQILLEQFLVSLEQWPKMNMDTPFLIFAIASQGA